MEIRLPHLEEWQQEVFDELDGKFGQGGYYIVKSGRQRGKTLLIKLMVIVYALRKKCINVIIEPVSSQCRRVHKEIVSILERAGLVVSSNAQTCETELINGSTILVASGESRDSIRGITCTGLCVFDECAFLSDEVIQIVLPLVQVHKAPVLMCSTPLFTEGFFYERWIDDSPHVFHFDWSDPKYDQSKYISQEQIEDYRRTYTKHKFTTEVLGEFIKDESFVFGDFKSCLGESNDDPIYGGIDFGSGSGGDYTVLTLFDAHKRVCKVWSTNNLEPQAQIDILSDFINNYPSLKEIRAEVNSLGAVYFDAIKDKLKRKYVLKPFTTTNESKRGIVEKVILAFQNKEIQIPNDEVLLKQLSYFQIKKTKKGYTYENDNPNTHDDAVMSLCIGYSCFEEFKTGSFGFARRM